jgi:hypothetical protein
MINSRFRKKYIQLFIIIAVSLLSMKIGWAQSAPIDLNAPSQKSSNSAKSTLPKNPPLPPIDPRRQTISPVEEQQVQENKPEVQISPEPEKPIEEALPQQSAPLEEKPTEPVETPTVKATEQPEAAPKSDMLQRKNQPQAPIKVSITAKLTEEGPLLTKGVVWHVFKADGGPMIPEKIVTRSEGGNGQFELEPGSYVVTADYGAAQATRILSVSTTPVTMNIVFNAGGMRINAAVSQDVFLPPEDVDFEVLADDPTNNEGVRKVILKNAPENKNIALSEGTYHVISRYGDLNAIVRADIRVEAGKLTQATIYHKAAKITLKLVNEPGGEALANTSWTILTPGGDLVSELVGAFPGLVLAEGDYTAIARHEGKLYNRDFSVETGLNREVELVAQ